MTRGPEQIVGILAALLAGAAYLPVDAAQPSDRRRYMLRDGQVRCVLTNVDPRELELDAWTVHRVDATRPLDADPAGDSTPLPRRSPGPSRTIWPTSSTPQARPASRRASWSATVASATSSPTATRASASAQPTGSSASARSPSTFPYTTCSVRSAPVRRSCCPTRTRRPTPRTGSSAAGGSASPFGTRFRRSSRSCTTRRSRSPTGRPRWTTLRLVMMSGDRIPPTLPAALRRLKDGLAVVALGGPTETTIWNIVHPIGADEDGAEASRTASPTRTTACTCSTSTAGTRPTGCRVRSARPGSAWPTGTGATSSAQPNASTTTPVGASGCTAPATSAATCPTETSTSSAAPTISSRSTATASRRARWRRGWPRSTRCGRPSWSGQARARHGRTRLVAHLVAADGRSPGTLPADQALREQLATHLPEYMIPASFVWHERLPLTGNGKVDRSEAGDGRAAPPAPGRAPIQRAADRDGAGAGRVVGVGARTGQRRPGRPVHRPRRRLDRRGPRGDPGSQAVRRSGSSCTGWPTSTRSRAMAAYLEAARANGADAHGRAPVTHSVINRVVASPPAPGNRISFVSLGGTETLDLCDLYERAERLALWMSANGLGPGDRIGIQAANCLEWVLLDLAALRAKVVTAGFEPGRFEPSRAMLDAYGLKRFFTDRPWDDPRVVPIADVAEIATKPAGAGVLPPVGLRGRRRHHAEVHLGQHRSAEGAGRDRRQHRQLDARRAADVRARTGRRPVRVPAAVAAPATVLGLLRVVLRARRHRQHVRGRVRGAAVGPGRPW